ncbi:MAG: glycosyltransferase family 39 protein, partial [Actinomycetes bacterium]
ATVIAVGFPHAFVARYWASVTLAATLGRDGAHIDPQEQGAQIWVCRDQRAAWSAIWPHAKHYD